MGAARLLVWGRSSSSNTQKVLWALRELRLPFQLVNASARLGGESELLVEHTDNKSTFGVVDTDTFYDMNPHRAIPTLRDGDVALWESNSIVRYLSSEYGGSERVLGGGSHADVGRQSGWMDWVLHGSDFAPRCARVGTW